MVEPRWHEIDAIFQAALERPAGERARFVAGACGSDADLQRAVLSLLNAAEDSGDFLGTPIEAVCELPWDDMLEAVSAASGRAAVPEPVDRSGERIGPWKLLRQIGRGGMATVYLAERDDGEWRQQAALKLIRRGLDTEDVVQRFLAERQILSSLGHPNIGRLFDGGSTGDGVPWFAMEYVDGTPITQYCDAAAASVETRLRLFREVARAVQYAHQNLVVHRDIKPSNIMVDAHGVPKLLDFGIAKLLDPVHGDPRTRTGLLLLTPEYASPEQLRGGPVTTASDVYQLGLLLGVLLSGRRPVETHPGNVFLRRPGASEMQPKRPSTLVTDEAARARGLGRAPLVRRLEGDLDTIVMKALRPEPDQRYASVEAMAADVGRHLEGLPIDARPATLGYRTKKLLHRNRWLMPVVIALFTAAGGYLYTVRSHARELERERNAARVEADRAREIQDFMVGLFRSANPYEPADPDRGADITVREALDIGVVRVRAELAGRPAMQATLLGAISDVYASLDLRDRAIELANEALDIARTAPPSADHAVTAGILRLGRLMRVSGQEDSAQVLLENGLARAETQLGVNDTLTARFVEELAALRLARDDFKGAETGFLDAIARLQTVDPQPAAELARAWSGLVDVYPQLSQPTRAREAAERALGLTTEAYGPGHPETALATVDLADALDWEGRNDEAITTYRRAIEQLEMAFGPHHNETLSTRNNLAVTLQEVGDYKEAEKVLRENLEIRIATEGDQSEDVATTLQNLAVNLQRQGRLDEAEALLTRAHAIYTAVLGPDRYQTAYPLLTRSGIQLERGDFEGARASAGEAVRILRTALPEGHFATAVAECRVGRALAGLGDTVSAIRTMDPAVNVLVVSTQTPPAYEMECLEAFADLLEADGQTERAAPYRARIANVRAALPPSH